MGIFKRKESKNSIQAAEKDDRDSFVSVNSARTSSASLKSPGYKGSGLPSSIPEMPISGPPDPALDPAAFLRSIHAVRQRSHVILRKAKRNQLNHFDVDMTKFAETASYVVSIIKVSHLPYVPTFLAVVLLIISRETMRPIIRRYLPMAVGNILMWAEDPVSTNYSNPGPAPLMPRSALGD